MSVPFLQNIFEENPQTQFIINNVLSKPIDVNKLPESDSLNNINKKVIDTIETKQLSESDSLNDMNRKVADTIETKQLSENDSLNNMNRKVADAIETGVPCFFKNAGVVLIHPFLSHLFRKLNLLETNEFKDFESQSKAVLLIHYLATENEHPLEYEMVLPKFLCSMPVNMPIDHTLLITEEEKMEINNVLQAAIEHWGALGNVTPDSLREGFLMREGKLEKEETGWKLHVEQKTLDVLLDKLPWNLSIIKLPWMKDLLKVEWR